MVDIVRPGYGTSDDDNIGIFINPFLLIAKADIL